MRSVSVRLADLQRVTIPIGYVGENLYTKVIVDCKKEFDEHPTAVVGMTVEPPEGDPYPAVVTRDGDFVVWEVSASDLVYKGAGNIQISFTVDGTIVGKSPVGRIMVNKSIEPSGEVPTALDDFLTRASTILNEIPDDIAAALEAAKESGEFDGADGFSPTVSVTEISGGHQITITDAEGDHIFTVMDGADGQDGQRGQDGNDGVSPTVSVSDITGGHRVTIVDAEGTHTFDVMDGQSVDPTSVIDDTSTAANKVWSSKKSDEERTSLLSAITPLTPSASASDVGKVLKAKTVADGKVSEYEFGSLPSVPVTDVQVNGSSILSQGVANVPVASVNDYGTAKINSYYGVDIRSDGILQVSPASESHIKAGTRERVPIAPANQHISTFYGLAKVSGDTTQASSSNTVGTYTEDAKRKITDMIEPQFRKIYEVTLSEDTEVIYTDTDLNGLAFALKEVVIEFDLKAGASSGIGAIVVNNGSSYKPSTSQRAELPYIAVTKLYDTSAQFRVAHLWVSGGRFFGDAEYTNFSNADTPLYIQQSKNSSGIISCSSINDILIMSLNSYTFKTASKITIYGR